MRRLIRYVVLPCSALLAISNCQPEKTNPMGTYGYDKVFFKNQQIDFVELKEEDGQGKVLVVPAYQGRVMTSTADGNGGTSFGWINHSFIEGRSVSGSGLRVDHSPYTSGKEKNRCLRTGWFPLSLIQNHSTWSSMIQDMQNL